jgi:cytoskeletal protein CcmA (bactofilin family)
MSEQNAQPKKGSFAKGCLIVSGVGCLVVLIGFAVLTYVGVRFVRKQYAAVMERFENQGYRKVEGQIIDVTERVTDPTLYLGQSVRIRAGSERGLAFVAQTVEISGTVQGNVYFAGQVLTINKDAELMQDVEVTAQVINNYGTIHGAIKGVYQALNEKPSEAEE